jgi:dihydrofolate reductase
MNISIIVAIANNNAIGKDNKLLCHLPNDLKWFKENTTGKTVIMGKNTFLSLPKGALPNRRNIVISDDKNDQFKDCIMAFSIEDALNKFETNNENFIIGGASIYQQFLSKANRLYLTRIYHDFDADAFLNLNLENWTLIKQNDFEPDEKNKFKYSFQIFQKNTY